MLIEPLFNADVKKLILGILDDGHLNFTTHAREELANDGMNIDDARNALRKGICRGHDLVRGTYRYRIQCGNRMVVVAFRSEVNGVVITAWEIR